MWAPRDDPGLEDLRLTVTETGAVADGLIVRLESGQPLRARYVIRCDPEWRTREVIVERLAAGQPVIHLLADGEGHWTAAAGALPALGGCIDVDFAVTPFTNTLPIRRLGLRPGESAELAVAYIGVPDLTVTRVTQRYTCLASGPAGARYRYEGLLTGFMAELPVDADGLVFDYPNLWQRVWPG